MLSLEPGGARIFSGISDLRKLLIQEITKKISEKPDQMTTNLNKTHNTHNIPVATFLDRNLTDPIDVRVGKSETDYFINMQNSNLYGISAQLWDRFVSRWSTEKWFIFDDENKWNSMSLQKIGEHLDLNHGARKWISCSVGGGGDENLLYYVQILIQRDFKYFWFDSLTTRIGSVTLEGQISAFVNDSLFRLLELFELATIMPDYFHIGCTVGLHVNRHLGNSDLVKIICSYY